MELSTNPKEDSGKENVVFVLLRGSVELKAQKSVLSQASVYLDQLIKQKTEKNRTCEAHTIELLLDDPQLMKGLITQFYGLRSDGQNKYFAKDSDDYKHQMAAPSAELMIYQTKLYMIALKYHAGAWVDIIQDLLSMLKTASSVDGYPTAFDTLVRHVFLKLKNPPSELRAGVVHAWMCCMDRVKHMPQFKQLNTDINALFDEVIHAYARQNEPIGNQVQL